MNLSFSSAGRVVWEICFVVVWPGSMYCCGVGSMLLCGGIYPSVWCGIYMTQGRIQGGFFWC